MRAIEESEHRLYDELEQPRAVVERAAKEAARLVGDIAKAKPGYPYPYVAAEQLLTTYFNSLLILALGPHKHAQSSSEKREQASGTPLPWPCSPGTRTRMP